MITTIEKNGKKVIYLDHSNLKNDKDELLNSLKEANKYVLSLKEDNILTLTNFTGTYNDARVNEYIISEETKEAAKKVKKAALLGINEIKRIFVRAYNLLTGSKAEFFSNVDEAVDYLTKD